MMFLLREYTADDLIFWLMIIWSALEIFCLGGAKVVGSSSTSRCHEKKKIAETRV